MSFFRHRSEEQLCKTHLGLQVPQNADFFQNVHGAVGSSLLGLAKWVDFKMAKQLESRKHLLRSSEHLVEELREVRFTKDSMFVRVDVCRFFMPGTVQDWWGAAIPHMPESEEKHVFRSARVWFGEHQFILSDEFLNRRRSFKFFEVRAWGQLTPGIWRTARWPSCPTSGLSGKR